jgi:hypothetical protein
VGEFNYLHERLDALEARDDEIVAHLDDIVGLMAKAFGGTPVGDNLVQIGDMLMQSHVGKSDDQA